MECGSIQEEFSDLGIDVEDLGVLDMLNTLATRYCIDNSKISCEYFSFNTKNKLGTKPPTLETLIQFENEKLKNLRVGARKPLDPIEGAENLPDVPDLGPVGTPVRVLAAKRGVVTPESNPNKRFVSAVGTPVVNISAPSTPTSTQSGAKYSDRTNKGEVVVKHNCDGGLVWEWVDEADIQCKVVKSVKQPYKYMFERMRDTALALDETICRVGDNLIDHYKFIPEDLIDFNSTHPDQAVGIGRVQCDSDGKLNSNSVILHGSLDSCSGAAIPLDLSQTQSFSLFPGQVIAADCHNPTGSRLVASKVYDGVVKPVTKCTIPDNLTISVLVAAGPFSTLDSSSQEPLDDILTVIEDKKPNIAVLVGPFIDLKNNAVVSSDTSFSNQWIETVKKMTNRLSNLKTEIILVPSARDASCQPVYPQPPFPDSKLYSDNMKIVSDPVFLDISGVRIAVSSTDVLFHLGKEEISFPARSGDRMSRLASHLLQQGSMYPLYPPSEEINLDLERLEQFALIDETPHVMLLPSDLMTFVREVGETTIINPGRVTKGKGPGTYSIFQLRTSEEKKLETKVEVIRV